VPWLPVAAGDVGGLQAAYRAATAMAAELARAFCGARAAEGDVWITASVDAAGWPAVRTTITFAGALTLAAWLSAGGRMPAWATANAELDADVA
jgi:hypothetical protein